MAKKEKSPPAEVALAVPEAPKELTLKLLRERINKTLTAYEHAYERFMADAAKDFSYALQWRDPVGVAAGREVYKYFADAVRPGGRATVESLREYAQNRMQLLAAHNGRSTSAISNELERAELWVYASMFDNSSGLFRKP